MGLGSTIHQSWFKRFEFFLSTREPGGGSPWFHFAFFFFLVLQFFHSFPFSFSVNGSLFFLFLLGLDSSYSISPVPLVGNLLIFHAFVLSSVRYLPRIASRILFLNLSPHIHILRFHQPLIIIFLCFFGIPVCSLGMSV
jgi:hypothetical protein